MVKDLKKLKKFKKVTPSLKTGDILIHHTLVVHGSKKIKAIDLEGLTFQFKDKNASYDKSAIKSYEKSLKSKLS